MFDLDDDDAPIGRVLSRREALMLMGGAGAAGLFALVGCGGSTLTSAADSTTGGGDATGAVAGARGGERGVQRFN